MEQQTIEQHASEVQQMAVEAVQSSAAGIKAAMAHIEAAKPQIARHALETAAAWDGVQGKVKSRAQVRLAQAREADRAAGRKTFEPTAGDAFIRRLAWYETERIRITVALSTQTGRALDIRKSPEALRAFAICVLETCVYSEASDPGKYFANLQEAADWVDSLDPELQALTFAWSEASVQVNPLLVPPAIVVASVPEEATEEAETALQELLKDVPRHPVASSTDEAAVEATTDEAVTEASDEPATA